MQPADQGKAKPDRMAMDSPGVNPGAALRLKIRGRVQGVGFRWSMVQEAKQLGVRGWVRNRRDGSVEAMVTGRPEAVDRIVEWARTGPKSARVSAVDVFAGEGSFYTFDPWPTE